MAESPLPDPLSKIFDCPLRSVINREEMGMLTGSERTGWILHTKNEHKKKKSQRGLQ